MILISPITDNCLCNTSDHRSFTRQQDVTVNDIIMLIGKLLITKLYCHDGVGPGRVSPFAQDQCLS